MSISDKAMARINAKYAHLIPAAARPAASPTPSRAPVAHQPRKAPAKTPARPKPRKSNAEILARALHEANQLERDLADLERSMGIERPSRRASTAAPSQLPPAERDELRRRMGLPVAADGVRLEAGVKLVLGPVAASKRTAEDLAREAQEVFERVPKSPPMAPPLPAPPRREPNPGWYAPHDAEAKADLARRMGLAPGGITSTPTRLVLSGPVVVRKGA